MALTEIECKTAKSRAKPYKLFDSDGLFLLVTLNGARWWRFKYRFAGKEKLISLGVYPEIGLKCARQRRDEQRRLLDAGIDPSRHRQLTDTQKSDAAANSFEVIAREWIAKYEPTWAKTHTAKILQRMERDVFPWIGQHPISGIKSSELLSVLRRIEKRGAIDTAHRASQNCGQVFRYAISTDRAELDPSAALRGALPPAKASHYASIKEPEAIGKLMRDLQACRGRLETQCALRLAPYLFVRPGELRAAEWTELNLNNAEWRIGAERMKMGQPHVVPLPWQAVEIFKEIQPLTGTGRLVFPGTKYGASISENTMRAALMDLGYTGDVMTVHGFRSMASTLLNEQGWNRDVIERQLAHGERNKVRASYNFAEYLPERKKMMQAWADYLDALKNERKVVAGNFRQSAA